MGTLLQRWRAWRLQRTLTQRAIPDRLWAQTLERFPFLCLPDAQDARRLRELSTLFLSRKEFHAIAPCQLNDDMAVAIAAQACLPILHLGLQQYDAFVGIVVHADEVLAHREVVDEDGVVHHYDEAVSGEAMEGGPIMLSWRDVRDAGHTAEWGYNVVIHEFAHVLDMLDGAADGVPLLPSGQVRAHWEDTLVRAHQRFAAALERGQPVWLDPYAAEAPEEFFAVCCEAFFTSPHPLRHEHPEVYWLLETYFRQSPHERMPEPPSGDLATPPSESDSPASP